MKTAQDILNTLHDQFGLTDTELGKTLAVSREHVSRLRHGKKTASEGLYSDIYDLFTEISSEVDTPDQEAQSEYEQDDEYDSEVPSGSIPWGVIIVVGVLIAGVVAVSVVSARRSRKNQESDQITVPEQETPGTQDTDIV